MGLRAWAMRLAFTFVILGALLLYEAWRIQTGRVEGTGTRSVVLMVLGLASVGLGAWGVRLRHGPRD